MTKWTSQRGKGAGGKHFGQRVALVCVSHCGGQHWRQVARSRACTGTVVLRGCEGHVYYGSRILWVLCILERRPLRPYGEFAWGSTPVNTQHVSWEGVLLMSAGAWHD